MIVRMRGIHLRKINFLKILVDYFTNKRYYIMSKKFMYQI